MSLRTYADGKLGGYIPEYDQVLRDLELADRLALEVEKYLRYKCEFAPMWYSDLFSVLIDYKVKRGLDDITE